MLLLLPLFAVAMRGYCGDDWLAYHNASVQTVREGQQSCAAACRVFEACEHASWPPSSQECRFSRGTCVRRSCVSCAIVETTGDVSGLREAAIMADYMAFLFGVICAVGCILLVY